MTLRHIRADLSYRRYCDFGHQVSRRSYTNSPRSAHTTDRSVGSRQHISTFEQSEVERSVVIAVTQLHSGSDKPLWLSWRTKETEIESRSILRGKKYVDHLHTRSFMNIERQKCPHSNGNVCVIRFLKRLIILTSSDTNTCRPHLHEPFGYICASSDQNN